MPNEIKNYLKTSGKKLCIRQMKCKKDIVFCALIGAYIIFWRDKKQIIILIAALALNAE